MIPKKDLDISNKKYGELTALKRVDEYNWLCRCSCGKEIKVKIYHLLDGHTTTCNNRKIHSPHGSQNNYANTKIYRTWCSMKKRVKLKYNYLDKGIKICDEWKEFNTFKDWALTHGFKPGLTLERKDVYGDYCPSNCCFITKSEQPKNKSTTIYLTYKGKTMKLIDWAKELKIERKVLYMRYYRGKPIEEVLKEYKDESPTILAKYKNGNYWVTLYSDGTKISENNLDYFDPITPENMDVKITNYCPMNCPMCHERSSIEGKHANLNQLFFNTLHFGTELALGGGMVTSHPDLEEFLKRLKNQGVFANITVHQNELKEKWDFIKRLKDENLIRGLGVSFHHEDDEFWQKAIEEFPNMVIHLIAGYHPIRDFRYLVKWKPKILILGYKDFGRGHEYIHGRMDLIQYHIKMLEKVLFDVTFETQEEYEKYLDPITNQIKNAPMFIEKFEVVSFDNLALEQLKIKNHITKEDWDRFYQGEDGTRTMYIDAVEQKFAKTSTSERRYAVLDNVIDMFNIIKKEG